MLKMVLAVALLLAARPSSAEFTSYAISRGDGSLLIRNKVVRLLGVYFPNTQSVAVLSQWTRGFVTCDETGTYNDGSIAAICRKGGTDIGESLILQGVALAGPDAPFRYHAAERIAQSNGLGIWGFAGDQVIIRQGDVVIRRTLR